MPDWLTSLSSGFMPHGYCLKWDPALLMVFITGNIGIALAYFLIPLALRFFVGKRKDLPYQYMFKLFAAFILSCGMTNLAKVWTLYHADYWVEAALDLWTALVSLLTAVLLLPIIPKALALKSPAELETANSYSDDNGETSERLLSSSKRLLGVLNDLLDFSKLESGNIIIRYEKLQLCTLRQTESNLSFRSVKIVNALSKVLVKPTTLQLHTALWHHQR